MTENSWLDKISIVVCAKNSAGLLVSCLSQIKKIAPQSELIVVDGKSTDNSVAVAKNYTDKIISDGGKGLAYARQLGVDNATRELVAFIGPDNKISAELLIKMAESLENNPKLAAVFPRTEFIDEKNYWEKTTKYIYEYLISKVGEVDVVGTPSMYPRKLLREIRFDATFTGGCDDTDLSLRLKKAGYALQMINAVNYEKNSLDLKRFIARGNFHGRGDAEFYNKYKNGWTISRKMKSLLHPFRKYAMKGSFKFLIRGKILYIPGLFIHTWARYTGWYKQSKKLKKHNGL